MALTNAEIVKRRKQKIKDLGLYRMWVYVPNNATAKASIQRSAKRLRRLRICCCQEINRREI